MSYRYEEVRFLDIKLNVTGCFKEVELLEKEPMNRDTIRREFGQNAARYLTSQVHAKGASLPRLLELVQPQPTWEVLDIASAAGHTAFTFAPHVAHVWSTDITPEMLEMARQEADRRGLTNITVESADAADLPFPDERFDLVTCRIAPHHFGEIESFLSESARVLRPGGLLAVVDNVVPDGPAGDYVNAFEKFRDPSHWRCLTVAEWEAGFEAAGLALLHSETLGKELHFESWAGRHDETMVAYLRSMLTEVSGEAAEFLQPQVTPEKTTFRLSEGIFIGRKGG